MLAAIRDNLLFFLPVALLVSGLFFLIRLRFFFLLHPKKTVRLLFSGGHGKNSPIRSLVFSLSGTLGVGNIAGVSVAVLAGGAGALFWMWVGAFVSAVLKYAEITLAMRYRKREENGMAGSPMRYMREGVGGTVGGILAFAFAAVGLISSFCLGNAVQIGAAAEAVSLATGLPKAVYGWLCAVFVLAVLFGHTDGAEKVINAVIPPFCALYLLLTFVIILRNRARLPFVIADIFRSAFTPAAGSGGIIGFLGSPCLREGIAKGTFSHEAGSGTAPMSHARSVESVPARQGLFGLAEVFFDTVVLCTATGLALLLSGEEPTAANGGMLYVLRSFGAALGRTGPAFFAVAMTVFAVSTVICWSYYGQCFLRFFTKKKTAGTVYLLLYCLCIVWGSVASSELVWQISDLSVVLMTLLNLTALLFLSREVEKETRLLPL